MNIICFFRMKCIDVLQLYHMRFLKHIKPYLFIARQNIECKVTNKKGEKGKKL